MCKGKKTKYLSFVASNIQTWQMKVIVEKMENNPERNKHSITLRRHENQKTVQETEGCGQHKILHRR